MVTADFNKEKGLPRPTRRVRLGRFRLRSDTPGRLPRHGARKDGRAPLLGHRPTAPGPRSAPARDVISRAVTPRFAAVPRTVVPRRTRREFRRALSLRPRA